MAASDPAQAMILGITIKDVVTAILIPIVAVLVTVVVQARQQTKDRRTQILRMLLATRHMPSDAAYNASINLIPVEFNTVKSVMAAFSAYIQQVRFAPSPDNAEAHHTQVNSKQTKLIMAIMRKLGLSYSESDLQADAYISNGFVARDDMYIDSLKAARDAANAMTRIAEVLQAQIAMLESLQNTKPQ
jgi:hypothetical protein